MVSHLRVRTSPLRGWARQDVNHPKIKSIWRQGLWHIELDKYGRHWLYYDGIQHIAHHFPELAQAKAAAVGEPKG